MSRDWDESRWICGPAVAPKMFLKAASVVVNHQSQSHGPETTTLPPSVECAKKSKRLKPEKWRSAFDKEGRAIGFHKVLKAIVSGGVDHSIRPEVWEFLLGCYALGTTTEYREQLRQARRLRYEELIQQCHMMHGSIGSGTLAYTVGSKVMDVRVTSKGNTKTDHVETLSMVTRDEIASWSAERFLDVEPERFEDSKESFEDGELDEQEDGELDEQDELEDSVPQKSSNASSDGTDSGPSEEGEGDTSLSGDPPDYLRLPVRALFPTYVVDLNDAATAAVSEAESVTPSHGQPVAAGSTGVRVEEKTGEVEDGRLEDADTNPEITRTTTTEDEDADRKEKAASSQEQGKQETERTTSTMEHARANGASAESTTDPKSSLNAANFGEERVADWLWTLHRIVVDVVRTDRHLKFYEDSKNMARMSDILAVYAWVDPATGYCQGMSDLLSPFILIYENDADAFWCFESLLRRVRHNFQVEGPVGVMRQLETLTTILELTDVYVFKHFVRIGADSFLFAFRMLLVLFRRELSFGEALCMWEMMWAADFDHGISWALEYNCPELLVIKPPSTLSQDENAPEDSSYVEPGFSPLYSFQDQPPAEEERVEYHSRSPLCGLRAGNFWPRHSRHKIRTVSSILGKAGDDELSVFVVAAILVLNRNRFMKDVHSMDDAIKAFNDIQMEIKVRNCIRMAIKLRRKYQKRLVRRSAMESRANATQRPKQEQQRAAT